LTGFYDIIASTVPIVKPNIKVQFLNPIHREELGQWAEFRIGITAKKPELIVPEEQEEEVLLFDDEPLDIENEMFGEFAQYQARKNAQGIETREHDPRYGNTMEQDPRISRPLGSSSGDCSELNFEIRTRPISGVIYSSTDPSGELEGSHFIIFDSQPPILESEGGGIGVFSGNIFENSEIVFTSNPVSFTDGEEEPPTTKFVASISGDISAISGVNIEEDGIAVRSIRCFSRFINKSRVAPFDRSEYYLFIAMRDNARINNIVVREFDEVSSFSHTPEWIKDTSSNIDVIQLENTEAPAEVIDKLSTSNEYMGLDGRFHMGGVTFTGNTPSNFTEKFRLDSVTSDDQLSLPLRPSELKTSLYLGANQTETFDMRHIFNIDRFKLTRGSFNNKYLHASSIVTDQGETGVIQLNISGREQ